MVDKNCSEPWNDIGDCSNESGLCGKDSGVQKQYRNCTNGTLELCTQEDMFQEISCDIPCTTTETSNVYVVKLLLYGILNSYYHDISRIISIFSVCIISFHT